MFRYKKNYTQKYLDQLMQHYPKLKEINCFLAGGALLQIHKKHSFLEIRDWDIFLESKHDLEQLTNYFKFATQSLVPSENINSINFEDISLITRFAGKPEAMLSTFDFTVVCCAYVFKTKTLVYHKNFFHDIKNRRLKLVNYSTNNLHLSKYRVQKYMNKGFQPDSILTSKEICNHCYNKLTCLVEGQDLCHLLSD